MYDLVLLDKAKKISRKIIVKDSPYILGYVYRTFKCQAMKELTPSLASIDVQKMRRVICSINDRFRTAFNRLDPDLMDKLDNDLERLKEKGELLRREIDQRDERISAIIADYNVDLYLHLSAKYPRNTPNTFDRIMILLLGDYKFFKYKQKLKTRIEHLYGVSEDDNISTLLSDLMIKNEIQQEKLHKNSDVVSFLEKAITELEEINDQISDRLDMLQSCLASHIVSNVEKAKQWSQINSLSSEIQKDLSELYEYSLNNSSSLKSTNMSSQ